MGREMTVNDALAKAIRTIHYEKYGGFYEDSEILLDIKDTLYYRDRHIVEYDKLITQLAEQRKINTDLNKMLVAEQGLSQFAIDLRENYYDTVGYTDSLNEVFDYYTSRKHTVNIQLSKEDFESIRNDTYKKIKADLLESLGGCN